MRSYATQPYQCKTWSYRIESRGRSGTWGMPYKTTANEARRAVAGQAGVAPEDVEVIPKTKVTRSGMSRMPGA